MEMSNKTLELWLIYINVQKVRQAIQFRISIAIFIIQMKVLWLTVIVISTPFFLAQQALALTGSMSISPNTKYVNSGKITVDTSSSYNIQQPMTWGPLTFTKSYPPGLQGQSSYSVILSLVDLGVTASSSRIQFSQDTSANETSFTVKISSVLANYIQRMSYRYLILSGNYTQGSNLVFLKMTWNYYANVVQVASASPAKFYLATPINYTGAVISHCFLTGMDVKYTNAENVVNFFVTANLTNSSLVNFYLTSTSTTPTYVAIITFDFLAFNVGYYNQKNYATTFYGNIQKKSGSYVLNITNNCDTATMISLSGFSIQGDNFLDFALNFVSGDSITIASNNSDNSLKSFSINYFTMLTYYCSEPTPYLNLLNSVCYDICPVRIYSDSSTLNCAACPYDCYTCDNTNCLSCNTATDYRIMNTSSSRCVPLRGYFDNLTAVCLKCGNNCSECINASNCVKCVTGTYVSAGFCNVCPEGCLTCISSSQCQSCQAGFNLAANFLCYLPCNTSQYFNISTLSCRNCPQGCTNCINSTTCSFCHNGTYLKFNSNSSTPTCESCSPSCMTCLDFSTCTSCYAGFYFTNYSCSQCPLNQYLSPNLSCISQCPIRYYANELFRICQPCPYDCYTCNAAGKCLSCNQSSDFRVFNPQTSRCLAKPGYFDNSSSKTSACPSSCLACSSSSSCSICAQGYFLNNSLCQPCRIECSSCIFYNYCTGCQKGFLLRADNICYSYCPQRTYIRNSMCMDCHYSCYTCDSSLKCLSCSPSDFRTLSDQSCIPIYGYYDNRTAVCVQCPEGCGTCYNSSYCFTCKQGYYYQSGYCSECPVNCQHCLDANTCKVCNADYSLDSGQCRIPSDTTNKGQLMGITSITGVVIGIFIGVLVFFIHRKCQKREDYAPEIQHPRNTIPQPSLVQIKLDQIKIDKIEESSARTQQNQWFGRGRAVSANKDCSICLMEQSFFKTHCGHCFHVMCIIGWLGRNDNCPNCRELLDKPKHKIYCRKCHSQYKVVKIATLKEMVASRRHELETICDDCQLIPI